jgi:hypothetical protein
MISEWLLTIVLAAVSVVSPAPLTSLLSIGIVKSIASLLLVRLVLHCSVWHPACRIMKSMESVSAALLVKIIYYVDLTLLRQCYTA